MLHPIILQMVSSASWVTVSNPAGPETSRIRWTICALLFFATTLKCLDRQVLSFLAKTLETSIGWTSIQYGYITAAFQATYAIGLLGAGYIMDRIGTRKGYSLAVALWSFAGMITAAATSAFTFGLARAFLGLGESANFPACSRRGFSSYPEISFLVIPTRGGGILSFQALCHAAGIKSRSS